MYFTLFVGVLCLSFFVMHYFCVHLNFAIILKRKRKLVALLLLSYKCVVAILVLWLFLMVPWVGVQCVIVVFPDQTHLFFYTSQFKLYSSQFIRPTSYGHHTSNLI